MSTDYVSLLLFAFPSILLAFTVHEYAHARTAVSLGDPTPKYEGRLTLNPVVHTDPMGALVLLVTLVMTGGRAVIGWGKPVQFNSDALREPIRDGALIAFAGPLSNFVLAFLAGLPLKLGLVGHPLAAKALVTLVSINIALGLFNLIPFPPLDGWKVLGAFMPRGLAWDMKRFETRAGMGPMLGLMAFMMLFGGYVLYPPFAFLMAVFTSPL